MLPETDLDDELLELDFNSADDTDDDVSSDLDTEIEPSLTYRINFETGRIEGMCDGKEAVEQAVLLALNTERYAYVIFDEDYGIELSDLYGKDSIYVSAVLEDRIRECLEQDDRIESVGSYEADWQSNKDMAVSFEALLTSGETLALDEEVSI